MPRGFRSSVPLVGRNAVHIETLRVPCTRWFMQVYPGFRPLSVVCFLCMSPGDLIMWPVYVLHRGIASHAFGFACGTGGLQLQHIISKAVPWKGGRGLIILDGKSGRQVPDGAGNMIYFHISSLLLLLLLIVYDRPDLVLNHMMCRMTDKQHRTCLPNAVAKGRPISDVENKYYVHTVPGDAVCIASIFE